MLFIRYALKQAQIPPLPHIECFLVSAVTEKITTSKHANFRGVH